MARHKARSRRAAVLVGVLLVAASTLLTSLVGSAPAGAVTAPGLSVVAKNSDVLGRCNFTLQSVNAAAGTAQVRLAGNAQPASFAGYYQNAYTVVHCRVYGGYASFSPLLTQIDPYANGPIVPTTSENAVIARYTNYTVCAYAYVKKNDGSDSQTFLYCATA